MSFPLTQAVTIDRGTAITALAAAVNADATTINKSQIFAIQPGPVAARYNVVGAAGGTITTLTVQHEVSQDGGATWVARGAAIDMQTNREGALIVNPGELNRLKPATLVLGTAASLSVTVSIS